MVVACTSAGIANRGTRCSRLRSRRDNSSLSMYGFERNTACLVCTRASARSFPVPLLPLLHLLLSDTRRTARRGVSVGFRHDPPRPAAVSTARSLTLSGRGGGLCWLVDTLGRDTVAFRLPRTSRLVTARPPHRRRRFRLIPNFRRLRGSRRRRRGRRRADDLCDGSPVPHRPSPQRRHPGNAPRRSLRHAPAT